MTLPLQSVPPDYSTHVENIITTEGLAYSSKGLTPKHVTAPASKARSGFTLHYLEQDMLPTQLLHNTLEGTADVVVNMHIGIMTIAG